jgi:hypothetical protein
MWFDIYLQINLQYHYFQTYQKSLMYLMMQMFQKYL